MPRPLHLISVTVTRRSVAGLPLAPDDHISSKGAGTKKAETSKTATNTVSAQLANSLPGELAAPVNKLILKIHDRWWPVSGDDDRTSVSTSPCDTIQASGS